MTDKEKIRAEIERRMNEHKFSTAITEMVYAEEDENLLAFIDSLPEEKPSAWDMVDINKAIKARVKKTGEIIEGFYDGKGHFDYYTDHDIFDRYSIDEVELMSDKEPCKDLEEAAEEYALNVDAGPYNSIAMYGFMAGAVWQQGKMMKDAVEGYVNYYEDSGGKLMAEAQVGCPYHIGDKVKIIILSDDERTPHNMD